jgi:DNA-binding CsgD family transcriptional regulator
VARFELGGRKLALSVWRGVRDQALGARDEQLVDADATVLAAYAAELTMAGESAPRVVEISRRGIAQLPHDAHTLRSHSYLILLRTLVAVDELDRAGGMLDKLIEDSRRRGSTIEFAFASTFRAHLNNRRGDVFEAEEDARTALALECKHGWPAGGPHLAAELVLALIERDELEQAAAILDEANLTGPAGELPTLYASNLLLYARGRLHAAAGNAGHAVEDLVDCGRRQWLWEEQNPALIPWRSEAALALRALGRSDQAASLADEEVRLARRFGAPRAIGMALRARAALADGKAAVALGREAVDVLARSPARLEHARALADLGERVHRTGRTSAGRAVLREALELANMCGAVALERRVLESLRATGARPRRTRLSGPDALTPSEQRIARMAAAGTSNREIAEALFLTVRTIEFHLGGAYRKLHIDTRAQLAAALDGGDLCRRSERPAA